MTYLPQTYDVPRPPRVRFADTTPAVLRFQDGHRRPGALQVVSLTGGLLSVPEPLNEGSLVKLMFLTPTGPVLGAAEMLNPVTRSQQPFRFVGLGDDDLRRLRMAIQSALFPKEEEWIEKYRAALSQNGAPRRRLSKVVLGALTVGLLCLGSTLYLLHTHLLK